MEKTLTEGALFAGIMGFGEGFRQAGFQNLWAVEKEPFCRAVIRSRFPETELFEDVRECGKSNLRAVDVLTAGFPCQDLSVAGKRAGLAGARSGLFWEVVRILGELRPPWFVLENVPGLFSSNNGEDFRVVLESLDELGYGLAWRVLDSQFFGVAQRRRRVFIVGSFGKPCPAEVLFESEGGEGDFAESGETRERTSEEVAGCLGSIGSGGFSANCEKAADGYLQIADPLTHGSGVTGNAPGRRREDDYNLAVFHENKSGNLASAAHARALRSGASHSYQFAAADIVPQAISSKWSKGSSGSAGDEHHNLVSVRLAQTSSNGWGISEDGRTHTLDGTGGDAVLAIHENQRGEFRTSDVSWGLNSGGGKPGTGYAAALCPAPDTDRVRTFTGLPLGMDSARYRALGNAVTAKVSYWIAKRIIEAVSGESGRNPVESISENEADR